MKNLRSRSIGFATAGFILVLCAPALAQEQILVAANETKAEAPIITAGEMAVEEKKEEVKGAFTYSGYFDTYYFANLNKPASRNNLGASGISRGFDRYVGQFQLGMFLNRMSYVYKNTEVVGEIGFGPNVEYGSYGNDFRYRW